MSFSLLDLPGSLPPAGNLGQDMLGRNEYSLLRTVFFAGVAGHAVIKVFYERSATACHAAPFFLFGSVFIESHFDFMEVASSLGNRE
jgi:hypothetical protein